MTLAKLFTKWGLLGFEFTFTQLYADSSRIDYGSKYNGGTTMYCIVKNSTPRFFADVAHIIYRKNADGSIAGMINADIYFGDSTVFVKSATLRQLERIFEKGGS